MLKKWLKKRRGNKKHAKEGAENKSQEAQSPDGATRPKSFIFNGRKNSLRSKKSEASSPARKSDYTSIEKASSMRYQPKKSPRPMNEKPASLPSINGLGDPTRMTPHESGKNAEGKRSKKEPSIVRIRPIEGPKKRASPRRSSTAEKREGKLQTKSHSHPKLSKSSPLEAATTDLDPPIVLSPSQLPEQVEQCPPSPATADHFARDLSYLGVASPPSIDTALFAAEEAAKGDNKNANHAEGGDSRDSQIDPPKLIEAIVSAPESQFIDKQRSEVSNEIETSRSYHDNEFFMATKSESGTGSKTLELWLDEVNRAIEAHKAKAMTEFDRYHVDGATPTPTEEKPERDPSVSSNNSEALKKSKEMIDRVLKESIERSKAKAKPSPKGILKSKTVEAGAVKRISSNDISGSSTSDKSEEVTEDVDDSRLLSEDSHSSGEVVPRKVFSSSRKQKILDETEEETTSIESESSSSAYETLRQLNPTVSRDDTMASNSSGMNFFSKGICNIGTMMDLEEQICQMDDDDTILSNSTGSKDSTLDRVGGWLCFDAF